MGNLSRRVEALERRYCVNGSTPCPEHLPVLTGAPVPVDMRGILRASSPEPADRAEYQAEQEALAAQPPCRRCGWRPEPIFITTAPDWGQHDASA